MQNLNYCVSRECIFIYMFFTRPSSSYIIFHNWFMNRIELTLTIRSNYVSTNPNNLGIGKKMKYVLVLNNLVWGSLVCVRKKIRIPYFLVFNLTWCAKEIILVGYNLSIIVWTTNLSLIFRVESKGATCLNYSSRWLYKSRLQELCFQVFLSPSIKFWPARRSSTSCIL